MTELLLIRHGETDWNREHRFQGQIDVPLNARGREQAERLAGRLADESLDALYASDLMRAWQTAEPAARRLGMPLVAAPSLREQAFGVLEGMSLDEILVRNRAEWEAWRLHDADYALPGGGESARGFHARVVAGLRELVARHAGGRIAVVSHGGVLDMLYREANALPLAGVRTCLIPNAGVSTLRADGDLLEIVVWGDDAHVADLGAVHPRVLEESELREKTKRVLGTG